jgi:cysteine desulfurase
MTSSPLYLDYAATTPIDSKVLEVMLPYFTDIYGNAASATHHHGERAWKAVQKARAQVASLIKAEDDEIIFTSGATEAINLALKGIFQANKHKGKHIITVKTEHKAVLDTCAFLEEIGAEVTYLDVDENGLINIDELNRSITTATILVSVMTANNETGVIHDITEIGTLCNQKNVLFFTDATQAFGKIPLDVACNSIDLLSFSGHKIYGPKGIGGLYIRKGVKPILQIHGGGHEFGFRSGTLNVPAIVGMGQAANIAEEQMEEEGLKLKILRDKFEEALIKHDKAKVNAFKALRLPHISNLELTNFDSDEFILANKHNLSVALGSACTSNIIEPSHVLSAMGLTNKQINSSIRVSFGRHLSIDPENIIKFF